MVSSSGWAWTSSRRRSAVTAAFFTAAGLGLSRRVGPRRGSAQARLNGSTQPGAAPGRWLGCRAEWAAGGGPRRHDSTARRSRGRHLAVGWAVAPSGPPEGVRAGTTQRLDAAGDGTWPRCDPEDCNVMEGPRRSDDLRGPPVLVSRPDYRTGVTW